MDSVLKNVEAAIEKAEPKIEEAVKKTLGEDAAKKVHDASKALTDALHDPAKREKINEVVGKAQAKVQELVKDAKPTTE